MVTAMSRAILRQRCQRRMVPGMSMTYSFMGIASKRDKESATGNRRYSPCSAHGIEPGYLTIAVRDNGIGLCCTALDVREQIDNGHRLYIGVLTAVQADHESLLTIGAGTCRSQHNKKAPLSVSLKSACMGRRPALSALRLLCCTRVGISRQSAAVPRLCPLLRVEGLTEQLIAGHEGPALVPDGTLACPAPAVRQRPTGATWARAMSLAALLQKDIMLAYIYTSR